MSSTVIVQGARWWLHRGLLSATSPCCSGSLGHRLQLHAELFLIVGIEVALNQFRLLEALSRLVLVQEHLVTLGPPHYALAHVTADRNRRDAQHKDHHGSLGHYSLLATLSPMFSLIFHYLANVSVHLLHARVYCRDRLGLQGGEKFGKVVFLRCF